MFLAVLFLFYNVYVPLGVHAYLLAGDRRYLIITVFYVFIFVVLTRHTIAVKFSVCVLYITALSRADILRKNFAKTSDTYLVPEAYTNTKRFYGQNFHELFIAALEIRMFVCVYI